MIDKREFPEVFYENDDVYPEDVELFKTLEWDKLQGKELEFFQKMKDKVEGEFAPSADCVMHERYNRDHIFLVRNYYSEFEIGRHTPEKWYSGKMYYITLAETLKADLFPLLDRHITFLDWLRAIDFDGIEYDYGNCLIRSWLGNENYCNSLTNYWNHG